MKVPIPAWSAHVARYGDRQARERLRRRTRDRRVVVRETREGLAIVWSLIHEGLGGSPADNRRKFAEVIRKMLQRVKEQRERINGFCAPGVSLQRLP